MIIAEKGTELMDTLAAMRAVERGTFSAAAASLGLKVSTVSRYIAALEADLGAALFNRSTRRLHLTEAGARFHEDAVRILADLAEARLAASSLNATPQGLLRLTMPAAFGRRHIVPHLPAFLAAHPGIRIDATLTDETVDLIASGADLAIRIGALADSSLIARRLAPQRRALVASPAYLAAHPPPSEPASLAAHDCLAFALQPKPAWFFARRQPVPNQPGPNQPGPDRPGPNQAGAQPAAPPNAAALLLEIAIAGPLRANDSEALLDLALAGLGIALLPTWLAGPDLAAGRLTAILPDWDARIAPGPPRAIWAVYPPKKIVPPKVRAFIDYLERTLGSPPVWDR